MVRSYIVGGHKFSVSMPENSVLWNGMDNYRPFVSDMIDTDLCDKDISDSIFVLDIDLCSDGKDIIDNSSRMAEFDDETAYISLMSGPEKQRVFIIALNSGLKEFGGLLVVVNGINKCKLYMGACTNYGHGLFVINNSLMLLYALFTSVRNTMLIHASVVVADNLGYAFLGKSGTGKSTHTRLWLQNIPRTWLLNDDNPVVRVDDNGNPIIYGSPWSGKTSCYKNEGVRLKAVVRLSQAPQNAIRKLSGISAYAALAPSASSMKWEKKMADGLHRTLTRIIDIVGIYHLECLPDAAASILCHDTVK